MLSRPLTSSPCLRKAKTTSRSMARAYATVKKDPNYVKIVEVGPRDGLQNEKSVIPPEVKIDLINRLNKAGMTTIEAGSFVSPKWVPQMAATDKVITGMTRIPGSHYPVLVPNHKGLSNLLTLLSSHPSSPSSPPPPTDEIAVFTAATDAFSLANTNCTVSESLARLAPVVEQALKAGLRVRGYVSVVIHCPYTGRVKYEDVKSVTKSLLEMGCYEVSLGDTVGMGTPGSVKEMVETVVGADGRIPVEVVAGHFHDTFGAAVANVHTALSLGIRTIDSAVGGLGGCPYSPGATGNVATEDVIYSLKDSRYHTEGDLDKMVDIGYWISERLGRQNASRAGKAMLAQRNRKRVEKEREREGGNAESVSAKL
ncbi:aldolase [Irpex rosettiformis]|uniref:Aldolase n=1 Tax=Irpex rosettiformis TaxID=378272 RepID=A0ACB8U267_9APHY|nr:aldolase [Irpex rosettiformis]